MKKNFYLGFIALTALTVTSCSNDDVVMQSPDVNKAIEFGTYLGRDAQSRGSVITQGGSTAGEDNATITTDALTEKGFGVFAYYTDESDYVATTSPCNFMYNTKVSTDDWTYSPIKYWPNDPNDKLTFFAYAPYDDADTDVPTNGSDNISFNALGNMKGDPVITFKVNNEVKKQQDLLLSKTENIDIIKNNGANSEVNVGNKVNFQFAHALSRIGFTVKAITDEVTAGQTPKPLDAATTIVLKKVVLYGKTPVTGNAEPTEANAVFYTQGELNLNQQNINVGENDAYTNVAWTGIVGDDDEDAKQLFTLDNDDFVAQSAGATIYDEQGFILTENQGIIGTGNANSTKVNKLNTDDSFLMIIPQEFGNYLDDDQNNNAPLYIYAEYDVITLDSNLGDEADPTSYADIKSKVTNHISTPIAINFQSGKAYTLNLQLGMTSVKVTADVDNWVDGGSTPVDLPQNTQGQ